MHSSLFPLINHLAPRIFSFWNNPTAMLNNFKGLSFQSSGEDAALFGINVNNNLTRLRIYYHNDEANGLVKNLSYQC